MPFRTMSFDEMRSLVRDQIETLERWLRRLCHDVIQKHFDGSLANLPIATTLKKDVAGKRGREPARYVARQPGWPVRDTSRWPVRVAIERS